MKTLILSCLLTPMFCFAAKSQLQIARFEKWTKIIEQSLNSSSDPKKVAEDLLQGQARYAAFNLQALGRIYEKQDKIFRWIHRDFKELEDAMGTHDKWKAIASVATGEKKKEIQAEQDKAFHALVELLEKSDDEGAQWVSRRKDRSKMTSLQERLKNFDWPSDKKDRAIVVESLIDQVDGVKDTKYDLSILENESNKRGLHAFRRDLRWISIQAGVVDGAITFKSSRQCAIPRYSRLAGDLALSQNKYSQLPANPNEPEPCRISQCLFLAVVKSVRDLGEIKDKAETLENLAAIPTNEVPRQFKAPAQKIYDDLQTEKLMKTLKAEFKQCR